MRETRSSGSVEGVISNGHPYSDYRGLKRARLDRHENLVRVGELTGQ